MKVLALLLLATAIWQGCSRPAKNTSKLTIDNITIVAEGPLFEGSNTAQVELSNALEQFLSSHELTMEQLQSAVLTNCKLSISPASDSAEVQNFDQLQSISVSFAADALDMQAAGVLNPIEDGTSEIEINIAQEQEKTLDFLKQNVFYVVADANLEQDLNDDLQINCTLEFDINY